MKQFVKIPNDLPNKLSFVDIYRFFCLFSTPTTKGYTDATFEQIKELSGDNSVRTIEKFINRLKESNVIKITPFQYNGKRRNKYFLPDTTVNYRMIYSDFVELGINANYKGFLIALFGLCLNNTLVCNLPYKEIANKIGYSLSSIKKYMSELIKLGMIIKTEEGIAIKCEYFKVKNNELDAVLHIIKEYPENHRVHKIDWSVITNPIRYFASITGVEIDEYKKPEFKLII